MDKKELQLEQIAQEAQRVEITPAPPIFELYASLIAMSLSALMFLFPGILDSNTELYELMLGALPTHGWALSFMISGLTGAIGILANSKALRILALCALTLLFGTVTAMYGLAFPNFGIVFMTWLTVFTVASIPLVRFTGLNLGKRHKKKGSENQ